jgi:hypothetical protein
MQDASRPRPKMQATQDVLQLQSTIARPMKTRLEVLLLLFKFYYLLLAIGLSLSLKFIGIGQL